MAPDPTSAYARDVVAGRVVAGQAVRLSCQRHLRDLGRQRTAEFPFHFDPAAADRIFTFFRDFLVLDDGAAFTLKPWQAFIVGSIFGWLDEQGARRFRTAYIETGKGSGKTPLAAGIGLYGLIADEEGAAEIYSLGVTREQASYLFQHAKKMAEASAELRQLLGVGIGEHNIAWYRTHSYFRPLSSEGRSLDNKRPHMALIDELHEHPNAIVGDKMRAGVKGRRHALIFEITNSGYDRHSVCWQHHDYSQKVLEDVIPNESWFAYVCQLDEGDAWDTEGPHWQKANPNLGVSLPWAYLREQVREAKGMPARENLVRRLNFCQWTEQATRWIDLATWDACAGAPIDPEALRGRSCYLALDLSSTRDLSALIALFPTDDEGYDTLPFFWLPEESLEERVRRDRVPYDVWSKAGQLELTPGNVIDYDRIRARILECVERFDVRELAYDPWNATQLISQLEADGIACFPIRQGFASLTAPSKMLETLILSRKLHHGGHPVLRWNAANVATEQDAAGNLKPSKKRSTERIDGIVALVMGIDRASRQVDDDGPKWFESHGVVTL